MFGEEVRLVCCIEHQDVFEVKCIEFVEFEKEEEDRGALLESFIEGEEGAGHKR